MIKHLVTFAAALLSCAMPAASQTVKSLSYNTTNGNVLYGGTNTLTFTNNIKLNILGSGSASGFVGRSSSGTFALYGTNVTTAQPAFFGFDGFNATAFSSGTARTNLGLGTAATNPSTAFQPSSPVLSNLANNNGGPLTNLTAANVVGTVALASNITGTAPLATNVTGIVAIANGGTGANSAGGAITNLGLGSTNDVQFGTVNAGYVGSGWFFVDDSTNGIAFETPGVAAITRDNLGLGPNSTNTVGFNKIRVGGGSLTIEEPVNDGAIIVFPPEDVPVVLGDVYWNDPSVRSSLGFSTNLNSFWTSTSTNEARTNLGLGGTNTVTFSNVQINSFPSGSSTGFVGRNGTQLSLYGTNVSTAQPAFFGYDGFNNTAFSAGTARTNLGLGATWLTNNNTTNFRAAIGLGLTDNVNFSEVAVGSGTTRAIYKNSSIVAHSYYPAYSNTLITFPNSNSVVLTNTSISGTLTTTANVTMSGTANTAPNQTALSGSSLMTRDLMYSAQTDDSSGDLVGGIVAASTSGFGSAAGNMTAFGVLAQVGFVTNSYGGGYFLDNLWTHSTSSGAPMPANKVIDVAFKGVMFRVENNQNWVLRVAAGVGAASRVVPKRGENALSGLGWGVDFFYNGTNHVYQPFWYTTNYNVGPQTVISNLSSSSWLGRVYSMRLRQETNGAIKFWINNGFGERLTATPSWQTNVVWGANNFAGRHMAIECATAPNAAPSTNARIHFRAAYVKYEP